MPNERKVLEANDRFYQAFNGCDLDLMRKVWLEDMSVQCLHPGWHVLLGFASIIKSWRDIFENGENLDIKLSDVDVIASEDLAWVSCRENLFSIHMSGVKASKTFATNVFKRVNGEWKMILHHASSEPGLDLADIASN